MVAPYKGLLRTCFTEWDKVGFSLGLKGRMVQLLHPLFIDIYHEVVSCMSWVRLG